MTVVYVNCKFSYLQFCTQKNATIYPLHVELGADKVERDWTHLYIWAPRYKDVSLEIKQRVMLGNRSFFGAE